MARSPRLHPPFDLAALAFLAVASTACAEADSADGDGALRVGLWGEGASGESYHLRDAGFQITGNGVDTIVSAESEPDGTLELIIPFDAGDYQLELLPGWEVFRGDVGDPMPVQVEADLVTENPVAFTIADNFLTNVTYVFEVEGDLVPMNDGTLGIDVEFQEDDGICTPGDVDVLHVSGTGLNPVGQGEGWQSFTPSDDSILTLAALFWEAGSYPEPFTVNVYVGIGPSSFGLLASETFLVGDVAVADYVWLGLPQVPLTGGQGYAIEVVGADGWRTESGALPSATSSAGETFHKTMMLQGLPCD